MRSGNMTGSLKRWKWSKRPDMGLLLLSLAEMALDEPELIRQGSDLVSAESNSTFDSYDSC